MSSEGGTRRVRGRVGTATCRARAQEERGLRRSRHTRHIRKIFRAGVGPRKKAHACPRWAQLFPKRVYVRHAAPAATAAGGVTRGFWRGMCVLITCRVPAARPLLGLPWLSLVRSTGIAIPIAIPAFEAEERPPVQPESGSRLPVTPDTRIRHLGPASSRNLLWRYYSFRRCGWGPGHFWRAVVGRVSGLRRPAPPRRPGGLDVRDGANRLTQSRGAAFVGARFHD